jgi:pimeloyl-ACP methyl ester carboxylesterase
MVNRAVVSIRKAVPLLVACLLVLASACSGGSGNNSDDETTVAERDVRFETTDGLNLTGKLFGRGRVGVALAHMYPADATSWYPAARRIASAGYMALAFNFRGYADSEGETVIRKAPEDVLAAADFLKRSGAKDVAFVGASMGGTASVMAAAESQEALAVVAVSAPTRFRLLDAIFPAGRVQRPVLLLAARGDEEAFAALQELRDALPQPDSKVYGGDAHGTNLLADRPEAIDEIISFLERWAPLTREGATPES